MTPRRPNRSQARLSAERLVIAGGGVVGCATLREFALRGIPGLLIEKEPDVAEGTSKANSGILHTGFDARAGSIEARMLRSAAGLWPSVLRDLEVPFLPVGALMLAWTDEDLARLSTQFAANAVSQGVPTRMMDRREVRSAAPYLAGDVAGALAIPGEGVVDPFWLTRAYAEAAISLGARVRLNASVVGLEVRPTSVVVRLDDGSEIEAVQFIDAAGLAADAIAALAGDRTFAISPRKGEFLVSEEDFGVESIILPVPGPLGKGMLVTPIVFGGLLLGPTAQDIDDRDDVGTSGDEEQRILTSCTAMVPGLRDVRPVRRFAGLRHVSSTGDYVVRASERSDRIYLAGGIRSTGVSTSPAVAAAIADDVMDRRGWTPVSRTARPARAVIPEQVTEVVCLCRSVTRGEIERACDGPIGARTLDGAKRRSGAMFGDCQGNLCAVDVARIVADRSGISIETMQKGRSGSWIWSGTTSAQMSPAPVSIESAPDRSREAVDAIVVGAGASGRAAAIAIATAGYEVRIVERNPERIATALSEAPGISTLPATAIGLDRGEAGWTVLTDAPAEASALRGSSVVIATGAYFEPREQRRVDGQRPSGIMTADLAWRSLRAGLRPGTLIALVGDPAAAEPLRLALIESGASVSFTSLPNAIRGVGRLEAIECGDGWRSVDTLVLADRLVPQLFLLRGLGLVDGRPGSLPRRSPDGRLPLDGLWSAGCCVSPDIVHRDCAASGRGVGDRMVARLRTLLEAHP